MVVLELEKEILLFEQHEHARVCGELAKVWKEEYFLGKEQWDAVIYAIYEHDSGWIDLDQTPLLNKERNIPYSFIDYPLKHKLQAYTNCINKIEKVNGYAALLCSLHYSSFFERYTNGRGEDFLTAERKRQKKLRECFLDGDLEERNLQFHYRLLQFCDNLSLYLCMNRPGVDKNYELVWFRKGFPQKFPYNNEKRMIAYWEDEKTVSLTDFPFAKEMTVAINYKTIEKTKMNNLQKEYEDQPFRQRIVTIVEK